MKKITFKQFLYTYNFRVYTERISNYQDTKIIRIILSCNTDQWIEFGINDYEDNMNTIKIAKNFLSTNILNSYIESFYVDEDAGVLFVYIDEREEFEDSWTS